MYPRLKWTCHPFSFSMLVLSLLHTRRLHASQGHNVALSARPAAIRDDLTWVCFFSFFFVLLLLLLLLSLEQNNPLAFVTTGMTGHAVSSFFLSISSWSLCNSTTTIRGVFGGASWINPDPHLGRHGCWIGKSVLHVCPKQNFNEDKNEAGCLFSLTWKQVVPCVLPSVNMVHHGLHMLHCDTLVLEGHGEERWHGDFGFSSVSCTRWSYMPFSLPVSVLFTWYQYMFFFLYLFVLNLTFKCYIFF